MARIFTLNGGIEARFNELVPLEMNKLNGGFLTKFELSQFTKPGKGFDAVDECVNMLVHTIKHIR